MSVKVRKTLYLFLLSTLIISTKCISSAEPYEHPSSPLVVWISNPVYSKQLAAPAKVDEFYVCPPRGFTLEYKRHQNDNNIGDQFDWRGHAHADGTKPRFTVLILKLLPGFTNSGTTEEWLSDALGAMNNGKKHYVHTNIQSGKISNISFVRAYWQRDPSDKGAGKRYHGFQYTYSDDTTIIAIICSDVEPYYKSTLNLIEAAALTFHK